MTAITDEMPHEWVRDLTLAIEADGHDVADAHESAIIINLTPHAADVLDAEPGQQLVIGWTERAGVDWGLGHADHVPLVEPLGADTPREIAAAVHLLLTTGMRRGHAVPYAFSGHCACPVQVCGGTIPDPYCPDHGERREPAMGWHDAGDERCQQLVAEEPRYRCGRGHPLPLHFSRGLDSELWDDTCRCKNPA